MEILENDMGNIYLYLIFFFFRIIIKLLFYFKKTFFDFFFNFWLQLSFHVIHFQILTFEVLQRMSLLLINNFLTIWHLNIIIWYIWKPATLVNSVILVFVYLIISVYLPILLILVDVLRRKEVCVVRILHHWFKCIVFVEIALNVLGVVQNWGQ